MPTTPSILLIVPLLFVIGALAGVLAGLLGVGGGIVLVPAFFYAFEALGYDGPRLMQICLATSLATIVVTSIRSVHSHNKKGAVEWDILRGWAPGIMAGAVLGVMTVASLRSATLQLVFGILGLVVGGYMVLGKSGWRLARAMPTGAVRIFLSPAIGFLSVLMGIGGGSFGVPLMSLSGVPIHRAVATASGFGVLIAVPSVVGFFLVDIDAQTRPPWNLGAVNLLAFAIIVSMTLITTPLGVRLAHAMDPKPLKRVFGVFLTVVALNMLRKTALVVATCAVAALISMGCSCPRQGGALSRHSGGPDAQPPRPLDVAPVADLDRGTAPGLWHRSFPSAAEALSWLLREEKEARVIGFGEFHEKTGAVKVDSSVARFTRELLPVLARSRANLVVETWVANGRCGKKETAVVKDVEQVTKRPESTEDEVWSLLRGAKALGIQPHILRVSCQDYGKLLHRNKVDYEELLTLIRRHLEKRAMDVLHAGRKDKTTTTSKRKLLALYGGAIHNDLYPMGEGFAAFSYGQALNKATGGRYLEVDLFVPEYIRGSELVTSQPWYPLLQQMAPENRPLLIKRGDAAYVLIYRENQRSK